MNYLTNYYKNLSEQLQAKLNHLENLLVEMDIAAAGSEQAMPSNISAGGGVPVYDPSSGPNTPPVVHEFREGQPLFPIPGDGSRYPNGRSDENYHQDYYEYLRWWRKQDKNYQRNNPMPPPMPPLPLRKERDEPPSRGRGPRS